MTRNLVNHELAVAWRAGVCSESLVVLEKDDRALRTAGRRGRMRLVTPWVRPRRNWVDLFQLTVLHTWKYIDITNRCGVGYVSKFLLWGNKSYRLVVGAQAISSLARLLMYFPISNSVDKRSSLARVIVPQPKKSLGAKGHIWHFKQK